MKALCQSLKLWQSCSNKKRSKKLILLLKYLMLSPSPPSGDSGGLLFFIKAHRFLGGHQQFVFFLASHNHVFKLT